MVSISTATEDSLEEITAIHCICLKDDFITGLGKYFIRNVYYKCPLGSELGFGFVCRDRNKVVGFIIGSYDSAGLHKHYIRHYWHKISLCFLLRMITAPKSIGEVFSGLFIMKGKFPHSDAKAELLSLAVHPSYRGRHIAKQLVAAFKEQLKHSGIDKCFTMTHSPAAYKIYTNAGFKTTHSYKKKNKELRFLVCDIQEDHCENRT